MLNTSGYVTSDIRMVGQTTAAAQPLHQHGNSSESVHSDRSEIGIFTFPQNDSGQHCVDLAWLCQKKNGYDMVGSLQPIKVNNSLNSVAWRSQTC